MKISIFIYIKRFLRNVRNRFFKKYKNCSCKGFDLIFSLGEVCFCTQNLRRLGLQYLSWPFDWMYGSTFQKRIEILDSQFKDWLNIYDLKYIDQRLSPKPCDIYLNKRTGLVFNHDFKIDTPLEKSYQEVKKKYDRRINRLLKILQQSDASVLIVYMVCPGSKSNTITYDQIAESITKLNITYKAKIHLFYMEHDDSFADREYFAKKWEENVTIFRLFNHNRNSDVDFTGNFDNISFAWKEISLKNQRRW